MNYAVHEILQARILEWVAFPFSRGSSQPRDWIQVSHIADASKPSFRGMSDGWSGFYSSMISRGREIFLSTCNQRRIWWKLTDCDTLGANVPSDNLEPREQGLCCVQPTYCHWWGWTFYFPVIVWSRARSVGILLCSVWFLTTRRKECGLGVGMKEWVLV